MKMRAEEIRSLMKIQYDLDQIALSNMNGRIAALEKRIVLSHNATREFEGSALSGHLGFSAISMQLEAHEQARKGLFQQTEALKVEREKLRAKSAISFAKWRVSKRL